MSYSSNFRNFIMKVVGKNERKSAWQISIGRNAGTQKNQQKHQYATLLPLNKLSHSHLMALPMQKILQEKIVYNSKTSDDKEHSWAGAACAGAACALLAMLGLYSAFKYKRGITASWTCHAREREFYLVDGNADPFFQACKAGDNESVQRMIADGKNLNERCKCGWTPLMVAAANGNTEIVRYLLEAGADPDIQDEYDPLLKKDANNVYNLSQSFQLMSERKLRFCGDLDEEVSFVGCTALHYAALMNSQGSIALLYDYGVDDSLKNCDGNTAAQVAADQSRRIIDRLQEVRKKKRNTEVFRPVKLKDILQTELIGQGLAIDQVSSVITRMEMGWVNTKHPMVLMFVGATGLGKTETAKILARCRLGGVKDSFVHINLSEYQTEHEAAKFIGAPPGYVGYSETSEGQLIPLLAKNPKAVVLFDEADKAHPNVLSTLLQLFDEGRLTSGSGKTVDCAEAIFVLTANIATEEIDVFGRELRTFDDTEETGSSIKTNGRMSRQDYIHHFKSLVLHGPMKAAFKRDELLGRINELAIFLPFSGTEEREVIENQLCQVRSIAATHGLTLTWDPSVLDLLQKAFNKRYGARYMRHEVDRQVVSKLSAAKDRGLYKAGEFLHLEVQKILGGYYDHNTSDERIGLCKISPLGKKESLDIHFADFKELFKIMSS